MKKLFILFALAAAFGLSFSFTPPASGLKVGDKAADFKLKNVDGKKYKLSKIKNAKGYIVVFTCNHCPFAKAYEDRIIALHKKYESQGYPVVAINSNDKDVQPEDNYERMQEVAKNKSYDFLYLYDDTQNVAKSFGATRTPHVFILDKSLTVKYIGAIDDNSENADAVKNRYVENAVDALLAGKAVEKTETKAVGCGIKWKKKG